MIDVQVTVTPPVTEDVKAAVDDGRSHLELTSARPDRDCSEARRRHYWVIVPDDWGRNQALCAKAAGVDAGGPWTAWLADRYPDDMAFTVTTNPDHVTCTDCLEWMHA